MAKRLTRMRFRPDNQAYEIHYLSPNKKKGENSITVPLSEYENSRRLCKVIAEFLFFKARKFKEEPDTPLGIASGSRITEKHPNDIIMQDSKKVMTRFMYKFG